MFRDSRCAVHFCFRLRRHVVVDVPRKGAAPALAVALEEIGAHARLGGDLDARAGDVGEVDGQDLAAADDEHVALGVRVADGEALAQGLASARQREERDGEEAAAGLEHAHLDARAEFDVPEQKTAFGRDGVDDVLLRRGEGCEAAAAGRNVQDGISKSAHLRSSEEGSS